MTIKVTRGELITFRSEPTDATGVSVSPDTMLLYLNYFHSTSVASTDPAIAMTEITGGIWEAQFDTKVCFPGAAFASVRASNPAFAQDIKFTITANAANPAP